MDGLGVEMYGELDAMSRRLEPIMTKLAKACLSTKPEDIDQFCYNFFASRLGISPGQSLTPMSKPVADRGPPTSRGGGESHPIAADDDLDDDEAEEEADFTAAIIRAKSRHNILRKSSNDNTNSNPGESTANTCEAIEEDGLDEDETEEEADFTAAIVRAKSRKNIVRKKNYESSDDDCDPATSQGLNVNAGGIGGKQTVRPHGETEDEDDSDYDEESYRKTMPGRVKSMTMPASAEIEEEIEVPNAVEQARIDGLAAGARRDPRMRQLFEIWDADSSGSVDLMELVVALHKFNRVMEDGSGLARASNALIVKGETAGNNEFDMEDFSKFIVRFCDEAYGKQFEDMAAHMLAVAKSTSERAALATAEGGDASQIMADDEAEIEILKETVRGVEESVVDNIEKIKERRRVMFK